jgi:hypothetical protein
VSELFEFCACKCNFETKSSFRAERSGVLPNRGEGPSREFRGEMVQRGVNRKSRRVPDMSQQGTIGSLKVLKSRGSSHIKQ